MHYSLSDMILDLFQNSVESGARQIQLEIARGDRYLTVHLADDGCGMTEGELELAKNPFFSDGKKHKHRKVGLGIPFLIQTVEQSDGLFTIRSEKDKGTSLDIQFDLGNLDTPPEGDWAGLFLQALCFEGEYELNVIRNIITPDGRETGYTLNRSELREILGDFHEAGVLLLLRDFLRSQEDDLS